MMASPVADKTIAHLETEKEIIVSGIPYVILQVALYANMIPVFTGEQLLETRTIYLPAADGKAADALRSELGAGAIIAMDETGKYDKLTGPEAISWSFIAQMLTNIRAESFTYVSPTAEQFIETLQKSGAPQWLGPAMSGMLQALAHGEYAKVTSELETILGRKPKTVYEYLQTIYSKA